MARVPHFEEHEHPDLAELVGRVKARRGGRLLNLDKVLLHSPPIADGWRALMGAVRQQAKLDDRTRELAITHVAVLNGADYEYQAHAPLALEAGATREQIDALPSWRGATCFDARDRDVLAYCESMTREIHVPDDVFAAVARHFDTREVVELTVTIASYNMVSRVLEALRVDPQAPGTAG
jgi:AhpD family alkylhydroperoxidase